MNKNGDSATMYGTIPAVAGLNRVEGFDPSSLLGRTVSPATGEEGLQLSLACKKLWFRLAYPKGRLQTERISITEQMAVFEARVYLDCSDTNPVSSFVSGCTREDASGGRYIQTAQDEAMDRALTDAGFGLQFADMRADGSTAGTGEKPEHSGTGAAVTEKGSVRNTGTAGPVVPAGNTGHAGNVVRPFPGASDDGGTKKTPAQGAQPFGARQSAQAVTVSQGQPAVAGTRQPVHTGAMPQSQGGKPIGTVQPVRSAVTSQGQGGQPVGSRQPAHTAVQQGHSAPMGTRQPVHTDAISQGQGGQPAGTRQPIPASAPQGQRVQPTGGRQGAMPVMPRKQEMQAAGGGQPVRTVIPQDQRVMTAGNTQPVTPTMPQKQTAEPVGNRPTAQETKPAGTGRLLQAAMPQRQGKQPGGNGTQAQPLVPASAATGKAAPAYACLGEAVKDSIGSGEQAAAQNPAMEKQGKPDSSAEVMGGARPVKGQRYFDNPVAVPATPQNHPPHDPMTARPAQSAAPQEMPGQLPVPPASMEGRGTGQPDLEGAASAMVSLPVPPMGRDGQVPAKTATATEDALPVPADAPEKRNARSSVQEAMALLKGNALPVSTTEGGGDNMAENAVVDTAAEPGEAASMGSQQPVDGEPAQGGSAARYTPDMPVEEIVSLMTLEEAGKVVVDTGVSKGQTVAEVAERRPPSLKYYRYGGYKGPNNILRAAAQVMLDSMEGQKAG